MSANPQPRPVVPGDLDLLISRSLDGDLSAHEERELRELLASDASARARYDDMARLVGRLEELPDPEPPFALGTRVQVQVEADTQGIAAVLQRYGFYFRPATVGIIALGIGVAVVASSLRQSPGTSGPVATVAERAAPAPEDDGRVSVYFLETGNEGAAPAAPPASAPAAAPPARAAAPSRAADEVPRPAERPEPVLVASAEASRAREDASFAPERDAIALAATAPGPAPAARGQDGGIVLQRMETQKSASSPDAARLQAAPPAPGAGAAVEVVGASAGSLRPGSPLGLEGLMGSFEGRYRLRLDHAGRVVGVVRLDEGAGAEPPLLRERLGQLSFAPAAEAGAVGEVEVRVRIP